MKSLTRRGLLQGLGAFSALAAFRPLAHAAAPPSPAVGSAATQINVVLHGMFAIVLGNGKAVLYAPEVSPHVYLGGTWLAERPLSKGQTYDLSASMISGKKSPVQLDPNNFLVFSSQSVHMDLSQSFCTIVLPTPDNITPLRSIKADSGPIFKGLANSPKHLPTEIVLSYDRTQVNSSIQLTPLNWTPAVNLHLWATPETMPPPSHNPLAALSKLLGIKPLQLNSPYDTRKPPAPDVHPPVLGLSGEEEKNLIERKQGSGTFHTMDGSLVGCSSAIVR